MTDCIAVANSLIHSAHLVKAGAIFNICGSAVNLISSAVLIYSSIRVRKAAQAFNAAASGWRARFTA